MKEIERRKAIYVEQTPYQVIICEFSYAYETDKLYHVCKHERDILGHGWLASRIQKSSVMPLSQAVEVSKAFYYRLRDGIQHKIDILESLSC